MVLYSSGNTAGSLCHSRETSMQDGGRRFLSFFLCLLLETCCKWVRAALSGQALFHVRCCYEHLTICNPQWCSPSCPWQLLTCAVESGTSGWAAASVVPRGLSGLPLTLPPAQGSQEPLLTSSLSGEPAGHWLQQTCLCTHFYLYEKTVKRWATAVFSLQNLVCAGSLHPNTCIITFVFDVPSPLLRIKPLEGKGTEGPKLKRNCSTLACVFLLFFQTERLPLPLWEKDILFVTEWETSI